MKSSSTPSASDIAHETRKVTENIQRNKSTGRFPSRSVREEYPCGNPSDDRSASSIQMQAGTWRGKAKKHPNGHQRDPATECFKEYCGHPTPAKSIEPLSESSLLQYRWPAAEDTGRISQHPAIKQKPFGQANLTTIHLARCRSKDFCSGNSRNDSRRLDLGARSL